MSDTIHLQHDEPIYTEHQRPEEMNNNLHQATTGVPVVLSSKDIEILSLQHEMLNLKLNFLHNKVNRVDRIYRSINIINMVLSLLFIYTWMILIFRFIHNCR